MKKFACIFLCFGLLIGMAACQSPDDLQLDIYKGTAAELKLLHLNASNAARKNIIEGITRAITEAEATDKPMELLGFYPDYTISVTAPEDLQKQLTVVLDLNGEWVEFYYPGPYPQQDGIVYRSKMPATEFFELLNTKLKIS